MTGLVGAVGLEDPHRPRGAHPVAVQEQHDLADHLLLRPALHDLLGALGPDPDHLPQALRVLLDRGEHALGERLDQLAGVDASDALDHAGAEIALDALEGGRRGGREKGGLELEPVGAVVDPGADDCRCRAESPPWPSPISTSMLTAPISLPSGSRNGVG
jgi:hypothetical protein